MQRKLTLLSQAIRAFTQTTPSYDKLLETITQKTSEALDCFCAIGFVSEDGAQLNTFAASAKDPTAAETLFRVIRARPYQIKGTNPISAMFETGEPFFVPKTSTELWQRRFGDLYKDIEQLGIHSFLCIPIRFFEGSSKGVLTLMRYGEGTETFSEDDIILLESYAEYAAVAITNAKLLEEKQREIVEKERLAERLRLLSILSTEFAESGDSQELLQSISSRFGSLFRGACVIRLLRESSDGSLDGDTYGLHPDPKLDRLQKELLSTLGPASPTSLAWRVFTSRKPIFLREISLEGLPPETQNFMKTLSIGSFIAAPLIAKEKVIGIVASFRSQGDLPYSQDEFEFFLEVASKASLYLLNANLSLARQRELEEKKKLSDRLQLLSQVAQEFASMEGDLERLLDVIVRRFHESLGGSCIIRIFQGGLLSQKGSRSYHPDPGVHAVLTQLEELFSSPIQGGPLSQIMKNKRPLQEDDISRFISLVRENIPAAALLLESLRLRSMLMVPLLSRGGVIGIIGVMRHHEDAPHTAQEFSFFQDLSAHASLSVINADLVRSLQKELQDREAAEKALKKAEDQLRHSQKMEAVGRLAGGVAHDFNNILSVIMGYAEFLQYEASDQPNLQEPIQEISQAAERAAALTKQLLSFSRHQTTNPRILSANSVILHTEKMLRRLIGESIELRLNLSPKLGQIKADSGQLEQILMNLIVNARDAISDGGRIVIETKNVEFDEESAKNHLGNKPGFYVMIAVSDNGIGMDKATQEKIFEPFFTTKERGKGTGLGLSTVFGIVQQHNGSIWVYSEPNTGTTFKIYFPQTSEPEQLQPPPLQNKADVGGSEAILLVEDDEQIRTMVSNILKRKGYKLLVASNGEEAWRLIEAGTPQVDLLFSDVVMPKLSGPDLARRAQKLLPKLKVLFMSGYTEGALGYHTEALQQDLLAKPFTPDSLLRRVREVLNR